VGLIGPKSFRVVINFAGADLFQSIAFLTILKKTLLVKTEFAGLAKLLFKKNL
jgi:hypothetical protein